MSEPLTLVWSHDPRVLRPALSAWWQSAVPRPSITYRLVFWTLAWIGVLLAAMAVGALGLDPGYVLGGLVGVAVFIIGFFTLQRTRMRAFYAALGEHWDRAGETVGVFGPDGVVLKDDVSESRHDWASIDGVAAARRSTVLRTGIAMIAVPDAALPDGMTPKAFRAQLAEWQRA